MKPSEHSCSAGKTTGWYHFRKPLGGYLPKSNTLVPSGAAFFTPRYKPSKNEYVSVLKECEQEYL